MTPLLDVLTHVRETLIYKGYGGLCCDECGCGVDSFAPCLDAGGEPDSFTKCVPAQKTICANCAVSSGCEAKRKDGYCYFPAQKIIKEKK